jgi:uncharacterized protein with NRDE domain
MCLILFAYDHHPRYQLVVASNRDEFYQRPTSAADYWADNPDILAGRDLQEGGTWLGISTAGRFAALTNYRDPSSYKTDSKSRGHLVKKYLCSKLPPESYIEKMFGKNAYNDFNLLLGNTKSLYYYSNREDMLRKVPAGVHGLSNALLNDPWPKVKKGRQALLKILESEDIEIESLFDMMADQEKPDDHELPQTGVGLEKERMLAPAFVMSPNYGTRSSTVLLVGRNHKVQFGERSFPNGNPNTWEEVYYEFRMKGTL